MGVSVYTPKTHSIQGWRVHTKRVILGTNPERFSSTLVITLWEHMGIIEEKFLLRTTHYGIEWRAVLYKLLSF